MSVVANVAINVDSSNAVSKLKQVQQGAQATSQAVDKLNATTAATSDKFKIAANGIKYFTDAAGRARAENGRFLTIAERAAAGIQAQGMAAQQAAGKLAGFGNALGGLRGALVSIGAGALVAGMVRGAATAEQLQLRLKLLSREYGETERVQQFVAQSARTFGQSQVEASAGVADVYARLRPLGTSLAQIETVYKGFNAVALASGTSAEAASGAFLQLSQALGSGRLQGDEFRSVAEQVPGILKLVADEMGVTVGQLKQLGSDGKITSDILINALAKGFEENKDKIAELLALSPAQRFKEFKDSTQALSNAIGSELLPAIVPVVKVATELLRLFGQLPGPMKTIIAAAIGLTAAFVALAPAISAIVALKAGVTAALGATAASAATATTSVGILKGAMLAIPGAGWTAAAIIGLGLLGEAVYDTNETFRNFVNNIGGVVASDFRSAVDGMADDARDSAANIQKAYEELPPGLSPIAKFIRELFQGAFKDTSNAAETSAAVSSNAFNDFFNNLASQGAAGFNGLSAIINNWWSSLPAPIRNIFSGNAVSMLAGAAGAAGSAAARASAPNAQATGMYGKYGAPESQVSFANAVGTPVSATVNGGGGGGGRAGGGGSSKAANEAKRAADEAARAAEEIRQQVKAADHLNFTLKNRLAIAQTTEPVAKRMLEYDIRQNEIAKEYDELKQTAKSADELILINANQIIEQRIAQIEAEQQINDLLAERALLMADVMRQSGMPTVYNELETQDAALQAILDKYPAIGAAADAAATLATSGMAAMIDGTKSAQEVFAEFLDTIANALMQTAAKMIAQYIAIGIAKMFAGMGGGPGSFAPSSPLAAVGDVGTGFNFDVGAMIPGRANGGPVSSGQTYMVGERGPELFVPGRSGTIVANDKMGGGNTNVVVNVDAKGSSVEGDEQGANQLGRVISAAVQSELIKQQRPGGILAR